MKVWAHTIVKNEERYVWFAVMSVINHVDKLLVYDTGSTDKTVEIIKLIQKEFPEKIIFREAGEVDINEFTDVRQEMLERTKADWVWILDADEVWWDGMAAVHRKLMTRKLESIVVYYHNLIGDIYHIQPASAGRYRIDNKEGHLTIRAMNMSIPGLCVSKPHGVQGFYDGSGTPVQERSRERRLHLEGISYLHFTHLVRSRGVVEDKKVPKRAKKYKRELGRPLPFDFFYPEVFFWKRPEIVPSPWVKRSIGYELQAGILEPLRRLKRNFRIFGKGGY